MDYNKNEEIIVERPQVLECDVVRFQNNKEKWVAFVGLLDGRPYEIFTGIQDDEEGIVLPKTVVDGKIIHIDTTSSLKIVADTRPLWRDFLKSSIPTAGTMPNSYPAYCATVCLYASWSSS